MAAARKAAEDAKKKAEEATNTDKAVIDKLLEKTADEVKAFEIEAINQSAIAVNGSKDVKKLAFDQVSDGIDKWHSDAGDYLAKSKSKVTGDMNKFKGTLSQILTNMQNPPYSSSPTIKIYIAHIETQIREWDLFTNEIDETYNTLETTELPTIAIKSLKAVSPAVDFTTTVATAMKAFKQINIDIDAAVKKVDAKIKEINVSNKANIEDKVAEDTAEIAATVTVAVTANLGLYLRSEKINIRDAANKIVATARATADTAATAATATAAATAVASSIAKTEFQYKLDQLLNLENKAAAITAAISAIDVLDKAQQHHSNKDPAVTAAVAAVTTAVTAAVDAAQKASTKKSRETTLQWKNTAEAQLKKAEAELKNAQAAAAAVASVVTSVVTGAASAAPAPAAPPPPAPAPVLDDKIVPYVETELIAAITDSLAKLP